jgi:hypothetical protein
MHADCCLSDIETTPKRLPKTQPAKLDGHHRDR